VSSRTPISNANPDPISDQAPEPANMPLFIEIERYCANIIGTPERLTYGRTDRKMA